MAAILLQPGHRLDDAGPVLTGARKRGEELAERQGINDPNADPDPAAQPKGIAAGTVEITGIAGSSIPKGQKPAPRSGRYGGEQHKQSITTAGGKRESKWYFNPPLGQEISSQMRHQ